MSFVPGYFGKFGRPTNDLLATKFDAKKNDFRHGASVKTQADGVTIKANSTVLDDKITATVNIAHEDKKAYGNSTLDLDVEGAVKINARLTQLYPGLAVAPELSFKTNEPKNTANVKVVAEYSQPNVAVNADYSTANKEAVVAAVYGQDGVCGGVSLKLNTSSFDPSKIHEDVKADFGVTYEEGSLNLSAVYDANKKATFTAFHRVSGDFQIASKFETEVKKNTLSVGGQYKINASTLFKGKAVIGSDASHTMYGYLQHSMANPNVIIGVSGSYNHERQSALGVKLAFGEY